MNWLNDLCYRLGKRLVGFGTKLVLEKIVGCEVSASEAASGYPEQCWDQWYHRDTHSDMRPHHHQPTSPKILTTAFNGNQWHWLLAWRIQCRSEKILFVYCATIQAILQLFKNWVIMKCDHWGNLIQNNKWKSSSCVLALVWRRKCNLIVGKIFSGFYFHVDLAGLAGLAGPVELHYGGETRTSLSWSLGVRGHGTPDTDTHDHNTSLSQL